MPHEHKTRRDEIEARLERAEKTLSATRNSASGHSRSVLLHLEREIQASKKELALHDAQAAELERCQTSCGHEAFAKAAFVSRLSRQLKDFRGVFEGLPHAPGERNSNQCPSEERLGVKTAPADSTGAVRPNSLTARCGIYAIFFLYMPLAWTDRISALQMNPATRRQAST